MTTPRAGVRHLDCTLCGKQYDSEQLLRLSPCCEKPLYARYDLDSIRDTFNLDAIRGREPALWRYAEVLPVHEQRYRLTLGEGFTPLLHVPRLAAELGVDKLWLKDEGQNPTGSFKARGLVMAVARAWEL